MSLLNTDLRTEIDGILRGYQVPMDDRGLVLEKIELALEGERQGLDREVGRLQQGVEEDRLHVQRELDEMKARTQDALGDLLDRIEDAYVDGFQEGLAQAPSNRPGLLHWAIGAIVLGVAVYFGLKGLFGKRS